MLRTSARCLAGPLAASPLLLKKSGKPADNMPASKQVYLPYDIAPSKAELDAARRKFSRVSVVKPDGTTVVYPVRDVPENMFTYGKEGSSVAIAIFKDEQDPVIGPEHTYPGIYENKVLLRTLTVAELQDGVDSGNLDSPLRRGQLAVRVNTASARMATYMSRMRLTFHNQ